MIELFTLAMMGIKLLDLNKWYVIQMDIGPVPNHLVNKEQVAHNLGIIVGVHLSFNMPSIMVLTSKWV